MEKVEKQEPGGEQGAEIQALRMMGMEGPALAQQSLIPCGCGCGEGPQTPS